MKNQAPVRGPYRSSIRGASAPVTKASVSAPSVCRVRWRLCQPPAGAGAGAAVAAADSDTEADAVAYGVWVMGDRLTGTGADAAGVRRGAADARYGRAGGAPPAAGPARACGG